MCTLTYLEVKSEEEEAKYEQYPSPKVRENNKT